MSKRRNNESDLRNLDAEDDPIGLTSAFKPVRGQQSVDYDSQDDPVGLTSAFGAVVIHEDERPWSEEHKWQGFDWEEEAEDDLVDDEAPKEPPAPSADEEPKDDARVDLQAEIANAKKSKGGSKHGRHAAAAPELSPRMKKSKRTRKVLIVLVILLILVVGALGYFIYQTFSNSQQEAAQQTQEHAAATSADSMAVEKADDAADSSTYLTDVPNIAQLLGMTQDEALAAIGHGALVTSNREVNEEGNPIKATLNVALTEEIADSKTGTPTVYLDLGEDGRVIQAGYSASAAALGFGSLSFADAISAEHVVEKTFAKTGVDIPEGSAVLPATKAEYTTYASDGTTVMRESCSFSGEVTVNGRPCEWSSILSYDYTTQVVTGNLTDTVRMIYVYITAKE